MPVPLRCLLLAALLTFRAVAAPAPAAPKTLETVMDDQKTAVAAITTQRDAKVAALDKWHTDSLEILRKQATEKGNLDLVLAIKQEAERAGAPVSPDEIAAMPAPLPALRQQYDKARATITNWEQLNTQLLTRAYQGELETLEKRLTQAGDIDQALKVRAKRAAAAARADGKAPEPALSIAAATAPSPEPAPPAPLAALAALAAPPANPPPAGLSATPVPTGKLIKASIVANSPDAYPLGPVRRGSKISLQYSGGRWKAWGRVGSFNPDDEKVDPDDISRLVIALPGADGRGGEVLAMVPGLTKVKPFVFEAKTDYPALVLRINDKENSFQGNPGKVEYDLQITLPGR